MHQERRSVVWLRENLAPLMFKFRYVLIAVSVCAVGAMAGALGGLFKLAEDLPNTFVPEHPQQYFTDVQNDQFFVPEDWKYQVSVGYGLDLEEPISYSEDGQISPGSDRNTTLKYTGIKLTKDLQEALVADCKDARDNKTLVQDKEVYCLLNDLKDFVGDDFPYDDEKRLREALSDFYTSERYSNLTRDYSDYASKTGFVTEGGQGIKFYWVSFNTSIPPETNSGPAVLSPYFDEWESYAATCAAPCIHMTTGGEGSASWVLFRIFQQLFREVGTTVLSSLLLAFFVLTATTQNWWVSIFVVLTILCIVICVFGSVVSRGFEIGLQECIYIALTIGLSIDYAVHLTHFYVHASGTRYERAQEAISKIEISIIGGATTTMVAALPLFACAQTFLYLYGFFILFTSGWAFVLSNMLLVPLLMAFGPEGDQGTFKPCRQYFASRGIKVCQDKTAAGESTTDTNAHRAYEPEAAAGGAGSTSTGVAREA